MKNYLNIAYSKHEKPKSNYPDLLMSHILHDLLNINTGTIVDVGCGRGDQLEAIDKLGFNVIGLEREEKICADHLEYRQCDVIKDTFPLDDNVADVVFCKSVIEHIYLFQMDHFFSEMKRICRRGGYIVISTPDWKYNVKHFYGEYTHCTPFTRRSINHCLQIYELEQVSTYSLIPLPVTWNSRIMRFISDVTNLLSLPRKWGKWFRWSQDRQIIAYGKVKG